MKLFRGLKKQKEVAFDAVAVAKNMVAMASEWTGCVQRMNEYEPRENEHQRMVMVRNQKFSPRALKRAWRIPRELKAMLSDMDEFQRKLVFAEIVKLEQEARQEVRATGTWNCHGGEVMKGCKALTWFKADVEKEAERQI